MNELAELVGGLAADDERAEAASLAAFTGELPVEVEENRGDDRFSQPVILGVGGLRVKLHGADAERVATGINQVCQAITEEWHERGYRLELLEVTP